MAVLYLLIMIGFSGPNSSVKAGRVYNDLALESLPLDNTDFDVHPAKTNKFTPDVEQNSLEEIINKILKEMAMDLNAHGKVSVLEVADAKVVPPEVRAKLDEARRAYNDLALDDTAFDIHPAKTNKFTPDVRQIFLEEVEMDVNGNDKVSVLEVADAKVVPPDVRAKLDEAIDAVRAIMQKVSKFYKDLSLGEPNFLPDKEKLSGAIKWALIKSPPVSRELVNARYTLGAAKKFNTAKKYKNFKAAIADADGAGDKWAAMFSDEKLEEEFRKATTPKIVKKVSGSEDPLQINFNQFLSIILHARGKGMDIMGLHAGAKALVQALKIDGESLPVSYAKQWAEKIDLRVFNGIDAEDADMLKKQVLASEFVVLEPSDENKLAFFDQEKIVKDFFAGKQLSTSTLIDFGGFLDRMVVEAQLSSYVTAQLMTKQYGLE